MGGLDEIRDPRAFRWVEPGVSGLSRPREWDAVAVVDVPALAGWEHAELEFRVLGDGSVVGDVPAEAVEALTGALGLAPPFGVQAVRKGETEWAVGARELRSEVVELPAGVAAASLEVAVPPDGETTVLVDGEFLAEEPAGPLAEAVRELERLGRLRAHAFAVRADRLEERRWELTVDPL